MLALEESAMSIDESKLNEFLGKAVGDLGAAMSATLMLVDGTSFERKFDMCALLK